MTGLILDLLLIGIIVLCTWRGFRAGIINGILGILSLIIAIYGANLIATTYSGEFTGVVEPFASGLVDSLETKILDKASKLSPGEAEPSDDEEDDFSPVVRLTSSDTQDVVKVCTAIVRQLGLDEKIASRIADEVHSRVRNVSAQMNDVLTEKLCEKICFVAVFVIAFCLISIVFSAIGNVIDLAFGLSGLENLNHAVGGIFGAAKGIAIVIVITCVCRYLGLILKTDIIDSTHLMKRLMESNALASLLNI